MRKLFVLAVVLLSMIGCKDTEVERFPSGRIKIYGHDVERRSIGSCEYLIVDAWGPATPAIVHAGDCHNSDHRCSSCCSTKATTQTGLAPDITMPPSSSKLLNQWKSEREWRENGVVRPEARGKVGK